MIMESALIWKDPFGASATQVIDWAPMASTASILMNVLTILANTELVSILQVASGANAMLGLV